MRICFFLLSLRFNVTTKIANMSVITDFMANFRSISEFIIQLILTTMKKILFVAAVVALFSVNAGAQSRSINSERQINTDSRSVNAQRQPANEPKAPELEYVVRLNVTLGQAYSSGNNGKGTRTIIPITGGTFEGPDIKGEVLPGGADYQLAVDGRNEVEAIYCIRTDDGVTIHVRNNGIIKMGGQGGMYFRCAPKFEAPKDSKYAWMNESLFLCQPGFGGAGGGITLDVWRVK